MKLFGKIALTLLLAGSSLGMSSSVHAAAKEDALNAVVQFLTAQKNCDANEMMKTSEHSQKISNVKEFYTGFCKSHPLQEAKITDLSMVNDTTAIVSTHSTYKDFIAISTMPVVNKDGQWKIIRGVAGPGYVEFSDKTNRNSTEKQVQQAIQKYSEAINSGNVKEMKKYIKPLSQTNTKQLDQHLKAAADGPAPEVTALGVRMVSDSVAMAHIEKKYDHFSSTSNLVICKENGQWKIVFGSHLENAMIPTSDNIVEIVN
ncbi:nuclear transport factor 2 family protein [Halobacillus amylolyticus]|uniref:Nuclear transport factor 2 family protein n=1 Tax=Halobacillus amylolyticus TaxID=2932259 RepID=A0ABY4H8S7_9BACI|nr:nuclear transport factor 2 family protein [Halobacillus amylolyticus]UOR11274.1 nuclear transport factor 2 family protein [Halobacillus amylolyticus]